MGEKCVNKSELRVPLRVVILVLVFLWSLGTMTCLKDYI